MVPSVETRKRGPAVASRVAFVAAVMASHWQSNYSNVILVP